MEMESPKITIVHKAKKATDTQVDSLTMQYYLGHLFVYDSKSRISGNVARQFTP